MAAILSPLGLYGGNRKSKIPLLANEGYMPLEGEIENLCHRSIGRMPSDRNLLSLDASLAIPTRVLRFEVSRLRRRTPVRSVPTKEDVVAPPSSVLRSWLCRPTKEPSGFLVNDWQPRELGVASANRHS
jgi:hypothetical protein